LLELYKRDAVMLAWWGTDVECASALARLERDGDLDGGAMTEALKRLQALRQSWQEVQPVEPVRDMARRLLRVHNLRASDSLQLAAALVVSAHRPSTLEFVCLDKRLTAAAQREGFNVTPA
jgi:predicted nucleic acid-binding protein